MADAQPRRCLVGHATVALHGDHLVRRAQSTVFNMRAQLIECFAAASSRTAVLEEEHGTLERLGDRRVELVGI